MRQTAILKLKVKILKFFRLHYGPVIRLYKGFGNESECTIYGHALSLSPLSRKRYRNFFLYNTAGLLRLFIVKPVANARIELECENERFEAYTEKDGFFHFQWKPEGKLLPGRSTVRASWLQGPTDDTVIAFAEAEVIIPSTSDFAFISDIDDTFLISHSSNLRKRLYVLLNHNARSRRPFEGVVTHYQLLHKGERAFFYVSSSEWNLYDYIREFIRVQELPEGVFLLNQLKTFSKLMATGQGKHSGKFTRIIKIIEKYPEQKFVLLGDDSQKDPEIYAKIVSHFPHNIFCVYIRRVHTREKTEVLEKQRSIESAGVHFCYFYHSEDAITHSRQVGLA